MTPALPTGPRRLALATGLLALAAAVSAAPPAPHALDPATFVLEALHAHRVVFLGDIHPLAEPKRILVDVLERLDPEAGLDLLALEVGSDQQEFIDAYLASVPEDPAILVRHARTLRSHWGASEDYLAIYRAVYAWNHGPGRRPIRIVAADVRGWPIAPLSQMMAAGGTANRDAWMARAFLQRLARERDARVLVFMGGYHGLKLGGAAVTVGRATQRFEHWFAGHLAEAGVPVFSILTDARQDGGLAATRVFDLLAHRRPGSSFAALLDESTDEVREPLHDVAMDGYRLSFEPARFALRRAADAMIVLHATTPITPLDHPAE